MPYGLVYHVFDKTNGKAYVGQTTRTLDIRKSEHLRSKRNDPFCRALQKRPGSFVWSILTEARNQKDLDDAEIYWGNHFFCLTPQGYNLRLGAGREISSSEFKQLMSQVSRGRKLSPETIIKMVRFRIGTKLRQSTKDAIRSAHLKKTAKKVLCIETGCLFVSGADAARKLKLPQSNISAVLHGRRPKAGNFSFRFVEAPDDVRWAQEHP